MISRKTLLQKLELLKPALAENELCLVLTYYCFDGRRIIACNDRIAIITPCPSEFEGCVRGTVLSDILKVARHAAVVKLFADGEHAVVKLGKAQVKLPTLPIDDFLDATAHSPYPPPLGQLYASGMRAISLTQNCIRGIERKFLAAVEHCLQSVELNSTVPDKLGITAIPDHNELQLFSTNSITMNRAIVPLPRDSGFKQRVIFSTEFCRAMLRLAKQAQITRLAVKVMKVHVDDRELNFNEHGCLTHVTCRTVIADGGYALFAADDTLLFGKLIGTARPIDFVDVVNANLPKDFNKQAVPIPHRTFAPLLQRANRIIGIPSSEPYTSISVRGGEARFHGCSHHGEFIGTLHLPGHPDVELKVQISNVFKAFSAFRPQQILFGERAVVLTRGEHLRLVATAVEASPDEQ